MSITLVLEPEPRRKGANDRVIAILKAHGLGGGLHLYKPAPFDDGHLHAKIYAFSEPDVAWIGSFNPSGDEPENAEVIAEIGDQDRGHNLLLGIQRPKLTDALRNHVHKLAGWQPLPLKLRPHFNLAVQDGDTRMYFYPRLLAYPAEREIARLGAGDHFRGAISHLKKGGLTKRLQQAVKRGADVELLIHDTERRVPAELVEELANANVRITRVRHPEDLPMHAKFLLVDHAGESSAWLGSYNFNKKSRRKNAEVLLRTTDRDVIETLAKRFAEIAAMAQ